jgi:hypothetical protein
MASNAVLITGSRAPVALLLARTLRFAGYTVFTADSLQPNLGAARRASARMNFAIPAPGLGSGAAAREIGRLADEHNIGALVPTCEEVFHFAAQRSRFPRGLWLCFPNLKTLEQLHNKYSLACLADSLGLLVPPTTLLESAADVDLLDLSRDGILKRVYSRFSSHVVPLRGSPSERRLAARKALFEGGLTWVHQAWVDGRPVCTYSLCQDGEVRYHVAYTTPYTMGLGAGVFYESLDAAPSLPWVRRLAEATGFTGQLSLDFIENEAGLWLLECNPRATMGLALVADQPAFARSWRGLLEGRTGRGETGFGPPGLRRQMTLATLLFGGGKGRLGSGRSWKRWLRDLLTTPDVLAGPGFGRLMLAQLHLLALYQHRARALGMSLTEFTTHDIAWNGSQTPLER